MQYLGIKPRTQEEPTAVGKPRRKAVKPSKTTKRKRKAA
jgi:hypothetical protein